MLFVVVENDFDQIDRGCAAAVEPLLKEKGKEEEGGCILSTGTKMIQVRPYSLQL